VPEDKVAPKPANLSFEQAATVPLAGATALQGLRDMRTLRPGERVLIVGAAGGVGSFAVQIARAFGAEVTGVCSPKSVDMVRSIGAQHVIDYTREDFTRTSARYDLVFDLVGNRSVPDLLRVLTPSGTLVMASGNTDSAIGPLGRMLVAFAIQPFVRPKIRTLSATTNRSELIALKDLIEAGSVTPVIDRRYTLDQVPDAIRYHGEGHARGKTVIAVETRGEPERAYVPAVVATAASSAAV
jgi:NADPH:quinone reductase-like Zn-dependent oxidoreductase